MRRALLVCPGRGSYGRDELGSLSRSECIAQIDAFRAGLERPTVSEMDRAERYISKLHVAGENASILTFAATVADTECLARVRPVVVTGNSMGWYTALYAAGALDLLGAARLVETLGAYQEKNVVGGQVLYPVVDEQWCPDSGLQAAVEAACAEEGVHLSIRLGGTAVLAANQEGVRHLLATLPKVTRGAREFPLQLPLHSAFHTPLVQESSDRALADLADLPVRSPVLPLVTGDGRVFRPHASPEEIRDYTLTTQVLETYDFTGAITQALGDYGPEVVVALGPGDTLGGPIAQVMIALGWLGLRDRTDFLEAQKSEAPPVLSMARADQRAQVVAP
jgi:acyl transferase domain-containing protein